MEHGHPPAEKTWSFSFSVTRRDPDGAGATTFSWMRRLRVIDAILLLAALTIFVLEPLALMWFFRDKLDRADASTRSAAHLLEMPSDPSGFATHDPLPGPPGDVITPLNARDPSSLVMRSFPEPLPPAAVDAPPPPAGSDWERVVETAKPGPARKDNPARAPKKKP